MEKKKNMGVQALEHCNAGKYQLNSFMKYFKRYHPLYVLLLPALIYIIIFAYVPMYGIQIAFKDYRASFGIWGSEWVGLTHFVTFLKSPNFVQLIRNTLALSIYSLIAGFPVPIILAFMINEIQSPKFKKTVQMITYTPHFISTVAIVGLIGLFLKRETGLLNILFTNLGMQGKDFMADPGSFRTIYVLSGIWQNAGWGTVIYISALCGVDPEIIDAAKVDGASRLQKIFYIDFPTIKPTIITLLILNVGSLMSVGFEKVLLMQNSLNMETADVISTYTYRLGILGGQFSYTTAIGLFNSVINAILLLTFNGVVKKVDGNSLW